MITVTSIEKRYKDVLKTDLEGLAKGTARKFRFLISSLGGEFLRGLAYDLALDTFDPAESIMLSKHLGAPVYDNLVLDPDGLNITIDMVLMDVSMTKNIVKTQMQGVNGTFKEYISDGDFIINITGALFGDGNTYPQYEVAEVIELLNRPKPIRVVSKFLQLFEIDDIVVENYKFEAKEGQNNMQFFQINAISDTTKELFLTKTQK